MSADDLRQAGLDGRNATVGAKNPYKGEGATAVAWMLGYKSMLQAKLDSTTTKDTNTQLELG